MYTVEMADAFHAIVAPKNFGVTVYDNEEYITLKVDTEELLSLSEQERTEAADYLTSVKKALEDNGAIVLIVREAADQ